MIDGIELQRVRKELGLAQGGMALQLGVHPNNVSAMENGRRPIGPSIQARVALLRIVARLEGNEKPLATEIRALAEAGLNP
jgi:DNA-binding XRE family transcriptional regulator